MIDTGRDWVNGNSKDRMRSRQRFGSKSNRENSENKEIQGAQSTGHRAQNTEHRETDRLQRKQRDCNRTKLEN